jgi:hypothetical protein
MDKLWLMLFGGYDIWELIGYSIFFVLGMFLYSYLEVENRDKLSKNTPTKFSWKFWYKDNVKRYMASVLMVYVLFRFFIEMTGQELSEFTAMLMGFTGDGVVGMKKRSIKGLNSNRDKIMKENNFNKDENIEGF